jgi:hypothetical protein
MNQYATNNNPSRSAVHESACSVAYAAGFDHGIRGNKGLPRTMTVNDIFISRNSVAGSGVELRSGHRRGYEEFLARGGK